GQRGEEAQHKRPEQQAPFLPAVERRDGVRHREVAADVTRHVRHVEIVTDERRDQRGRCNREDGGEGIAGPTGTGDQFRSALLTTQHADHAPPNGEEQRQPQRQLSENGHGQAAGTAWYREPHLARSVVALKVLLASRRPSTTTSTLSVKVSGARPR